MSCPRRDRYRRPLPQRLAVLGDELIDLGLVLVIVAERVVDLRQGQHILEVLYDLLWGET